MFIIKKNYTVLIILLLTVCAFDVGNSHSEEAQAQVSRTINCIENSTGGYSTCFPIEGVQDNWQLYTYKNHCALDFYPVEEPYPGGGGDHLPRTLYKKKIYSLWHGEVIDKVATSSACGRMVRIRSTQEQAGQKIISSHGELSKKDFYVEYCHLSLFASGYKKGDFIEAGTLLGVMGASGGSAIEGFANNYWNKKSHKHNSLIHYHNTGSHLHLRVRVDNVDQPRFRRQSISEVDLLLNIELFNNMSVWNEKSWDRISKINKNNHCNLYTLSSIKINNDIYTSFMLALYQNNYQILFDII